MPSRDDGSPLQGTHVDDGRGLGSATTSMSDAVATSRMEPLTELLAE